MYIPPADKDFNSTIITAVFNASDSQRDEIQTPIPFTNDDIDEVDEFLVVRLELVSTVNPERVKIEQSIAQCQIGDDDGKCAIFIVYFLTLPLLIFM